MPVTKEIRNHNFVVRLPAASGKMVLYATPLLIALVAGVFGFTGVYVAAAGIAKVLFFVFLVLFIISLISGGVSRRGV